jgi:hypothetical protein
MLALLCALSLAPTHECVTVPTYNTTTGVTLQRVYAPAPFMPTTVTVVRYHNSQRIDVVYPPEFTQFYAPVLNDTAGDGGGSY